MYARESKAALPSSTPGLIFHPGLPLDACRFAVAFILPKIVLRKIPLTESFSYITVADQMAANIILKSLFNFLVNFVKFSRKGFPEALLG